MDSNSYSNDSSHSEGSQQEKQSDLLRKLTEFLEKNNLIYQESIGQGGYASCFRVKSMKYNQTFVCKVAPPDQSLKDELEVLRQADHPNIVKCYNYLSNDTFAILVLEDCALGNLCDYIEKNGPLKGAFLMKGVKDIFDSLEYLHSRQIAHLDLKPQNILIDIHGRLKLSDFGISKQFIDDQLSNFAGGTKFFMAPEIFSKKMYDPFKADVWSLGVTLFYMTCGKHFAKTFDDILLFASNKYLPFPSKTPQYITTLIRMCLRVNPADRPSITQLKETLDSYTQALNSCPNGFAGLKKLNIPNITKPVPSNQKTRMSSSRSMQIGSLTSKITPFRTMAKLNYDSSSVTSPNATNNKNQHSHN